MYKKNQAGFSLIELIVVMAISGSLVVIAFVGQRALRSRAQFDAAVNRIVAVSADARNQATAGVNITGPGDGSSSCAGGGSGAYVFAGVAWTADDSLPGSPLKLEYYKALPGSAAANGACVFDTVSQSLPSTVRVNVANPVATRGGRILYVRNNKGGLLVCPIANLTVDVRPFFRDGACLKGTLTLNLSDAESHTSTVTIDPSGLAKRQN